jgi:hypothetical protein
MKIFRDTSSNCSSFARNSGARRESDGVVVDMKNNH